MQFPGFRFVSKSVVLTLAALLAVPSWDSAAALQQPQQEAPPPQAAPAQTQSDTAKAAPQQVAENRGESTSLVPDAPIPDAPTAQQPPPGNQSNAPANQAQPGQDQQNGNKPVGTAAAPFEKPVGVAAARPAGAAIAPADTDGNTDPETQYDASGIPHDYYWDGCHAWLFRPDANF